MQKSLEETEQANDEAIDELLTDAKESAEELWTTYRNDMQEMCALYILKTDKLVEKNSLSEDDCFRIQGEIDSFFQLDRDEYMVETSNNNASSSSYSLKPKKGRGRPKGSKNIVSSSMGLTKKSRGRPKGSKNKVTTMSAKTSEDQDVTIVSVQDDEDEDIPIHKKRGRPKGSKNKKYQVIQSTPSKKNDDETETDQEEEEEEEQQVTSSKKRAKPSPHSARPPGRTPKGMQWCESKQDWIPMKLALKRLMSSPNKDMQWDATKEEWVPTKMALRRLM